MKNILIIVLVCMLSGCAFNPKPHPRDWTKEEKAAAVTFMVGQIGDTYTTIRLQDYGNKTWDNNRRLGKHPSDLKIGVYMATSGLIVLGISHWYPELRKPLLFTLGGLELYLCFHNISTIRQYGQQ